MHKAVLGNPIGIVGCSGLAGTVIGIGAGAITGSISGAVGAGILKGAGYAGYVPGTAAAMSAAGNCLVGGIGGLVYGSYIGLSTVGLFANSANTASTVPVASSTPQGENTLTTKRIVDESYIKTVISYSAEQVLGSMIGWSMFHDAGTAVMGLGAEVASVAVGAAVTSIPLTVGYMCCLGVCIACLSVKMNSLESTAPRFV